MFQVDKYLFSNFTVRHRLYSLSFFLYCTSIYLSLYWIDATFIAVFWNGKFNSAKNNNVDAEFDAGYETKIFSWTWSLVFYLNLFNFQRCNDNSFVKRQKNVIIFLNESQNSTLRHGAIFFRISWSFSSWIGQIVFEFSYLNSIMNTDKVFFNQKSFLNERKNITFPKFVDITKCWPTVSEKIFKISWVYCQGIFNFHFYPKNSLTVLD